MNDLDRQQSNLELALPHLLEAVQIYRAIGRVEFPELFATAIVDIEESLRRIAMSRAAAAAEAGGAEAAAAEAAAAGGAVSTKG